MRAARDITVDLGGVDLNSPVGAVNRPEPHQIGHLCIGCVEIRLGRTLTAADFIDAPVNTNPNPRSARSARLTERLNAEDPTARTPAAPAD